MKSCRHILLITTIFLSTAVRADLFSDLSELKKICDAQLLTNSECKEKRANILTKYDSKPDEWFCNYAGESAPPESFIQTDTKSFSESASGSSVVKEILDVAGLAPNFVVRPASVPNAAASIRAGIRYIEYNPAFISQLKIGTNTNWSVYSVMAHEIGHHLQGHTIQAGGSRPGIELEADEYSGFILAKLGARLIDAQKAMSTFGSNSLSGTHPPTDARLNAIQKGWTRGVNASSPSNSSKAGLKQGDQSIPPAPAVSYTDSCTVNGEEVLITPNGAVLSKTRGFMQVGQKLPPANQNCVFDLISNAGRYCVTNSGLIHFGTPTPVGLCRPCHGNICN